MTTAEQGRLMAQVGFDEFVAARSTHLLRTANLLTRDHVLAEAGPSWRVVETFRRGDVYELEAVVSEGLTGETRIAFVHYWPAG